MECEVARMDNGHIRLRACTMDISDSEPYKLGSLPGVAGFVHACHLALHNAIHINFETIDNLIQILPIPHLVYLKTLI